MVTSRPTEVRLAELVATLSLGTDLGLGQPMEHVIRQTLIALRMSELLGLDESERKVVYYSGLLAWVGCHTDAYEQAKWFGDDLAVKADGFLVADPGPGWLLRRLGAGRAPLERVRLGVAFVGAARRGAVVDLTAHWLAADGLARRLGLGDEVRQSLRESYERWDGKGAAGAKGGRSAWSPGWSTLPTSSPPSTATAAWMRPSRSQGSAAAPPSTRPWWTCSARRPGCC
jgi:hypothetical protein